MDWQLIIVCVALAGAGCYLVRQFWRTWFRKSGAGCASGCGSCEVKPTVETETNRRISLM